MKIVVVSPVFPYPPNDGDKLRLYNIIKQLSRKNKIYLFSFFRKGEEKYFSEMKKLCKEMYTLKISKVQIMINAVKALFSGTSMNCGAYASPEASEMIDKLIGTYRPDAAFAYRLRMAQYLQGKDIPKSIDIVDSLAYYMQTRLKFEKNIFSRFYLSLDLKRIDKEEKALERTFDHVFVNSDKDKKYLGIKNCKAAANGVDIKTVNGKRQKVKRKIFILGFFGNNNYPPNKEGITWFVNNVWKKGFANDTGIKLVIVGKGSDKIKGTAGVSNIDIKGHIDDIDSEVRSWNASVVPVRFGAGFQNKIIQSWANRVPVIAEKFSAERVNGKNRFDILSVSDYDSYFRAVELLRTHPLMCSKLADNGLIKLKKEYDWKKASDVIEKAINSGKKRKGKK